MRGLHPRGPAGSVTGGREGAEKRGPTRAGARSDGPLLHPGLELHKIRLLKLSPEEEVLILGENARRLLQL